MVAQVARFDGLGCAGSRLRTEVHVDGVDLFCRWLLIGRWLLIACVRTKTSNGLSMSYLTFYIGGMGRIGVRELNQNTSQVLARVRHGETLEVTERGVPI